MPLLPLISTPLFYYYKNKERTFFIYTYSAFYIHSITIVEGVDKSHISVFFAWTEGIKSMTNAIRRHLKYSVKQSSKGLIAVKDNA